ncbi:MAG: bifunctional diaminohydroxyphosphoribosylaminopyrimidine deaminase/5-amino-6-(5-phosphoribosylamino)uracil reductase RibD [Candidatus Dormibacteraceae bacterium]
MNDAQEKLDRRWMARALRLARRADYRTSPNPMVGCVVVQGDAAVGEGLHERAGGPHAEVVALRQAGERARGATVYVTLEPCSHVGATPPCTGALLRARVARVVVAVLDPDARVRGRGVRLLREGGVHVEVGVGAEDASRLNRAYLHHRQTGVPLVSAKFACSLDGRIATRTGASQWITGEVARRQAHRLRHENDAVLVGVGTVLADDPALTARFPGARQPLKIVLDHRRRTPADAHVRRGPAELLLDPGDDLPGLLRHLGGRGVLSVLVEGGSQVLGSFFDQGLVDRVYAYLNPSVLGGLQARPAVGGLGVDALSDRAQLQGVGVERLGGDILVSGDVHRNR